MPTAEQAAVGGWLQVPGGTYRPPTCTPLGHVGTYSIGSVFRRDAIESLWASCHAVSAVSTGLERVDEDIPNSIRQLFSYGFQRFDWQAARSGWRESNPHNQLGRLGLYH